MIPTENQEAETLANWLRANDYIFTHIANESGLPPRVAMLASVRKKRMGLSPGVPDFMIILKRGSLFFIELKRQRKILKNGKLGASPSKISTKQLSWKEKLNEIQNVQCDFAFGSSDAIEKIQKIEKK